MKEKNIMIFGDSYSTFKGYIPEGYRFYYSPEGRKETDVTRVEETWWYSLCAEMNLNLVLNDSWSGSPLAFWGWDGVDCNKSESFIYRLEKLIEDGFFNKNKIDTVLVFGTTNDSWIGSPLGEVKFEDIAREECYSVCPAICFFLGKLKKALPEANIVFIINTELKPEISAAIRVASEHYGTRYLELSDIDKSHGHPTIKGMAAIKTQVKEFLNENFNLDQ